MQADKPMDDVEEPEARDASKQEQRSLRSGDGRTLKMLMFALYREMGMEDEQITSLADMLPAAGPDDEGEIMAEARNVVIDGQCPFEVVIDTDNTAGIAYDLRKYEGGVASVAAALTVTFFRVVGHPVTGGEMPFSGDHGMDAQTASEVHRLARSIRMIGAEHHTVH